MGKIIQIAACAAPSDRYSHGSWETLFALDSDGTIWKMCSDNAAPNEWQKVPLPTPSTEGA